MSVIFFSIKAIIKQRPHEVSALTLVSFGIFRQESAAVRHFESSGSPFLYSNQMENDDI